MNYASNLSFSKLLKCCIPLLFTNNPCLIFTYLKVYHIDMVYRAL